jgi:glycosyltransferase involved in cell wall biosynthesis
VIVIAHDRSQFLLGAVESAIHQTLPRDAFEVVVVKDFQLPEVDEYLDRNSVAHVDLPTTTTTAGEMFRVGVERSRGDILCFLDDDDRFFPEKLAYVVGLFDSQPGVGYVHTRQRFVDADGVPLSTQPVHHHVGHEQRIELKTPAEYARADVVCGIAFNNSSIHIRREVLAPWLGEFARVQVNCDNFLALISMLSGRDLLCSDRVLCDYRFHGSGSSGAHVGGTQAGYYEGRRRYLEKILADTELFLPLIGGTPAEPTIRYFREYSQALVQLSDARSHRGSVGRSLLQMLGNPHQRVMFLEQPFNALSFATVLLTYLASPASAKAVYFQVKKMTSLRGR